MASPSASLLLDHLSIGNFDGDGWLDIFAAAYDNDFRLWLNQRDGGFSRHLFGREW